MAVTSRVRSTSTFGEVPIADWKKAGLIKPGVVKPVITTADKALAQRGRITRLARTGQRSARRPSRPTIGRSMPATPDAELSETLSRVAHVAHPLVHLASTTCFTLTDSYAVSNLRDQPRRGSRSDPMRE